MEVKETKEYQEGYKQGWKDKEREMIDYMLELDTEPSYIALATRKSIVEIERRRKELGLDED